MSKKISVILIVILLLNILVGCTGRKEDITEEERYVAISVSEVKTGTVSLTQSYSTKVRAKEESNVFANVQGTVKEVFVEVGDVVEEGDVLFTIDRPDLENQLEEVKKTLELSELNIQLQTEALESAKGSSNEQQIAQLSQMVTNSQIAYENAKDTYMDTLQLYEQGAVSEQQLTQAKSALDQSEVAYNVAKLNYDIYINEGSNSNINRAEIQLEQAMLQKEQAQLSIKTLEDTVEDTNVKSPISGVVTSVNVNENQMLGSNVIPITIIDSSVITVDIGVSENLVTKLKVGETVEVYIDAASHEPFQGTIKNISIAADTVTSKYNVKIEIDNNDGLIYSGMFAQVKFTSDNQSGVTIPVDAILTDNEGQFVYILKGEFPEKRYIKTGLNDSSQVIILEGLNENETLITEGQHYIKENSKVKVTE